MVRPRGVLFCGGGTGGHVLPGLSVAAACRACGEDDLRWVGDPERIEARLVPAAGIPLLPFGLSRPRPTSLRWLLHAGRQALACWRELRTRPPKRVVALGGYAALLPGLFAPLLGRPLIVLEQNARAGRTNRLLARFARHVVTQFPEAAALLPRNKVRCLGNPVRPMRPQPRGLAPELRVLVMGGSLSASSLNDALIAAAPLLRGLPGLHLIHLAGAEDRSRVARAYGALGLKAEVQDYCDDMPALYERIDLALCRSGATTVSELCTAGIGAIYVPLPWAADDHQTANARAVARVGGAVVLSQADCRPAAIVHLLRRFAADRALVARLGRSARRLAQEHAAAAVAALILREGA
jgi:UDP-N-acetylglucosamine--N-acetylmuramyl-(pentapeptide) pyrophosphoryl-undecaprenol N-acetylglucosamine transferase